MMKKVISNAELELVGIGPKPARLRQSPSTFQPPLAFVQDVRCAGGADSGHVQGSDFQQLVQFADASCGFHLERAPIPAQRKLGSPSVPP
jgi:hypothetical protein